MSQITNTPHTEYTRRKDARRAVVAREEARSRDVWKWRRIIFIVGIAMVVLGFLNVLPPWLLLLPLGFFIALMVKHQRIFRAWAQAERAADFYERGLARLTGDWAGKGNPGSSFADPAHPYAEDLDLFGQGSLFELLCAARTHAGETTLAAWLRAPAPVAEIKARQEAVDELRNKLDLREDLALLGGDVRAGLHVEMLTRWGAAPPVLTSRALRVIALLLGLCNIVALVLWFGYGMRPVAFAAFIATFLFLMRLNGPVMQVLSEVQSPSRELALLTQILARLEQEQFTSTRLTELRAALDSGGLPPSQQIARLQRLVEILDWTRNQFFAPIALLLVLPAQLAIAIDRWRQTSGAQIGRWLAAVGEIEALGSLAGYAYEHPHDPFPEIITGAACFDGVQLGHPLLPEATCVRNDVRLDQQQQLLIVSGSNMSGKSTLLRTIGVNVVLALAGAPVCAQSLRLTPLNVGASIHILDSLQAGASRFYAEITRLRQIVELTNAELPLLFLLDEILSGTNSHDRAIGASAVVKGLVERGALGLITTHDLALTRMADELGGRAVNVHFEDELKDGRMSFDYRMRDGVVQRSNALELMRAVGLKV